MPPFKRQLLTCARLWFAVLAPAFGLLGELADDLHVLLTPNTKDQHFSGVHKSSFPWTLKLQFVSICIQVLAAPKSVAHQWVYFPAGFAWRLLFSARSCTACTTRSMDKPTSWAGASLREAQRARRMVMVMGGLWLSVDHDHGCTNLVNYECGLSPRPPKQKSERLSLKCEKSPLLNQECISPGIRLPCRKRPAESLFPLAPHLRHLPCPLTHLLSPLPPALGC